MYGRAAIIIVTIATRECLFILSQTRTHTYNASRLQSFNLNLILWSKVCAGACVSLFMCRCMNIYFGYRFLTRISAKLFVLCDCVFWSFPRLSTSIYSKISCVDIVANTLVVECSDRPLTCYGAIGVTVVIGP